MAWASPGPKAPGRVERSDADDFGVADPDPPFAPARGMYMLALRVLNIHTGFAPALAQEGRE